MLLVHSVSNFPKSCMFFSVFMSLIFVTYAENGDTILNLKLGFDLTQGQNGAPALRIDSRAYNRRADDDRDSSSIRTDSVDDSRAVDVDDNQDESKSNSNQDDQKSDNGKPAKESKQSEDNSNSENSNANASDEDKEHVTRGLMMGDKEN